MNTIENLRSQFAAELTRDEMKNVVGGVGEWQEPGDGSCQVYYRRISDNSFIGNSGCTHTVEQAQYGYQNAYQYPELDSYISGYCCASCC